MKKRIFDWRSFITFSVAFSALVLFISGAILYIAPSGRVAHWTNWKILFGKEEWTDIHVIFSILFTVVVIFHIFDFNWKAFKHFFKKRYLALGISLGISTVLILGTYYYVPPLNYVREFNNYMKDYWERKTMSPPVLHAEELTLQEVAEKLLKIPPDEALSRLKDKGIKIKDVTELMKDIGEINNLSPQEVFDLMIPDSDGGENKTKDYNLPEERTLRDVAIELRMRGREAIEILKEKGLKVSGGSEKLKDIARENGITPEKIYKLLKEK